MTKCKALKGSAMKGLINHELTSILFKFKITDSHSCFFLHWFRHLYNVNNP